MRLYEMAKTQFSDDLANILRVMQGHANSQHTQSVVTWSAINNMIKSSGYAEVNQDMMDKVKDIVDPDGSLIHAIDERGITLATDISSPDEPTPVNTTDRSGKSVDQMSHNVVSREFK